MMHGYDLEQIDCKRVSAFGSPDYRGEDHKMTKKIINTRFTMVDMN